MSRRFRRFRGCVAGSAPMEFVLVFPIVMLLLLASLELGMLLTRQVMLDRGLDLAVRQVRLGVIPDVTHETLSEMICDYTAMIPDCANQLRLEMVPVDPRGGGTLGEGADCVDRENTNKPLRSFTPGVSNQLMFLRVCALIDPYIPTTRLFFLRLPQVSGGAYALVSSSVYVMEPL